MCEVNQDLDHLRINLSTAAAAAAWWRRIILCMLLLHVFRCRCWIEEEANAVLLQKQRGWTDLGIGSYISSDHKAPKKADGWSLKRIGVVKTFRLEAHSNYILGSRVIIINRDIINKNIMKQFISKYLTMPTQPKNQEVSLGGFDKTSSSHHASSKPLLWWRRLCIRQMNKASSSHHAF